MPPESVKSERHSIRWVGYMPVVGGNNTDCPPSLATPLSRAIDKMNLLWFWGYDLDQPFDLILEIGDSDDGQLAVKQHKASGGPIMLVVRTPASQLPDADDRRHVECVRLLLDVLDAVIKHLGVQPPKLLAIE